MSKKIDFFKDKYLAEAEKFLRGNPDVFTKKECTLYRKDLLDYLSDPPPKEDNARILVVLANKEVCGLIMFEKEEESRDYYRILWLVIKKSEQRKGYGTLLIKEMVKKIKRFGGKHIIVETSDEPRNKKVKKFYQKFGFKKIGVLPDYYPPPILKHKHPEDSIIYFKDL